VATPVKKVDRRAACWGLAALTVSATSWLGSPAEAVQIQQGFSGAYAPANWTFEQGGGNGFVDTSSAPGSIQITGSNDDGSIAINTDYTITAVTDGPVSLEWNFNSLDEPDRDTFGYLLNGVFFQLASQTAIGTTQFNVAAGNTFGFRVFTSDDAGPSGTATISEFSAPVPGPLPIFGAAAAFGWSRRLRRRTGLAASSLRSDHQG
jgi:hypothetical protein